MDLPALKRNKNFHENGELSRTDNEFEEPDDENEKRERLIIIIDNNSDIETNDDKKEKEKVPLRSRYGYYKKGSSAFNNNSLAAPRVLVKRKDNTLISQIYKVIRSDLNEHKHHIDSDCDNCWNQKATFPLRSKIEQENRNENEFRPTKLKQITGVPKPGSTIVHDIVHHHNFRFEKEEFEKKRHYQMSGFQARKDIKPRIRKLMSVFQN